MHTSCVGFGAAGAVGLVVFGAELDVCRFFFFPYFPPPLAAAFPPAVGVVGFTRCFLELCLRLDEVLPRGIDGWFISPEIYPLGYRDCKCGFVERQKVLVWEVLVVFVAIELAPFHNHVVALAYNKVDW